MNIAEIVGYLKDERDRLDRAIAALGGLNGTKRGLKRSDFFRQRPANGSLKRNGLLEETKGRTKVRLSLAVSTPNESETGVRNSILNYL